MALYYNTQTNKAYNGNIMYQYWGVPGNLNNNYTYTYDKLNRLMSGVTSLDNYQESGIAYDTQGNLTALNRYQAGTQIDQLMYYYNSKNSLDSVKDANASNLGLVSGKTSYTYDGNGNMLSAANTVNTGQNKSITYNILNLPNVVTVPLGTDTYTYDATGDKLRKVSVISGVTTNTDYIGGIQYNGSGATDTLSFIQTEEGKAVHNGTTYDYQYYLADNLGNTRVTFNTKKGVAYVVQQDDYYPFGLEINRTPPHDAKNEYLYNKKELQEDFNEYDYGARFYDPAVVHWNTIDPMAEMSRRWSPYTYVEDNPIRLIDPDGMESTDYAGPQDFSEKGSADDLLYLSNVAQGSENRTADQALINQALVDGALQVASAVTGLNLTGDSDGQQGGGDDGPNGNDASNGPPAKGVKAVPKAQRMPKPEKIAGDNQAEDDAAYDKATKVDLIGTISSYVGLASEETEEIADANKFIKTARAAKYTGTATILVGTMADLYLSTHKDPETGKPFQSWGMTGANAAVTVVAIVASGGTGLAIEAVWIGGKLIYNSLPPDVDYKWPDPQYLNLTPANGFH